jgi:hypothetical protein
MMLKIFSFLLVNIYSSIFTEAGEQSKKIKFNFFWVQSGNFTIYKKIVNLEQDNFLWTQEPFRMKRSKFDPVFKMGAN